MKISVLGLGRVGIPLSASLAAAGHTVVGVDRLGELVDAVNRNVVQSIEPDVVDRLKAAEGRLTATIDTAAAVAETDLSFVIVPTPSNTLGGYSLRFALDAVANVGRALAAKKSYHVVAIVSTMLPGSSERIVIPTLERAVGGKVGSDFGYCYNPAFIALGEVTRGFERPDFVLVGAQDAQAGDIVLEAHAPLLQNEAPIARMTPTEAEICKLASNTHETMRVSFANMLLSVCSEVPGANVDNITNALTHRMGRRFFKGATPYGGPCWPRDNQALSAFMDVIGTPSLIPQTVDRFNDDHATYILGKVLRATSPGDRVGLLGLAYKPGTNVIEEAFGVNMAKWLLAEGRSVVAWDPLATSASASVLGESVEFVTTVEECLRAASTVLVTNSMKEFGSVDWTQGANTTVIDAWRCLNDSQREVLGSYLGLGEGPTDPWESWFAHGRGDKLDLLIN